MSNDGAWHEEIEIEMRNEDYQNLTGTITMTEAKHGIYRDCLPVLGIQRLQNFDGVRFSYKGIKLLYQKHLLYDKGAPDWSAPLSTDNVMQLLYLSGLNLMEGKLNKRTMA